MPHPYEFNRLQETAEREAQEAVRAIGMARAAMRAAYPIGAIIDVRQKGDELGMFFTVVEAPHACQSLEIGLGWIWCTTHQTYRLPFQVDTLRCLREYHTFKVTSHPAPAP